GGCGHGGGVLLDVGHPGAPAGSLAGGGADFGGDVADDNADVGDAGGDERLDAVEQHRLVGDRDELLGARVGQRPQPGALAAAENESLHRPCCPPNAPNKSENVPMPASVNDRLNRWSRGTPTAPARVPKLNFWYS